MPSTTDGPGELEIGGVDGTRGDFGGITWRVDGVTSDGPDGISPRPGVSVGGVSCPVKPCDRTSRPTPDPELLPPRKPSKPPICPNIPSKVSGFAIGYFLRRFRIFAIYAFAAALPFTSRAARFATLRTLAFRLAPRAPAAFFFAPRRRFCVVRPPRLPAAFATIERTAAVCIAKPWLSTPIPMNHSWCWTGTPGRINLRRIAAFHSGPDKFCTSVAAACPFAPRFSAIPYLDESRFTVIESDSNADACAACWTDSSKTDRTECERSTRCIRYEFHAAIAANPKAKLARIKDQIGDTADDLRWKRVHCANPVGNLGKSCG